MTTTTIQPIQTRYGGCLFRSRLEARWAVFLTNLGCRWLYEPEGFELPSGRYLPDFFIRFREDKPHKAGWSQVAGFWLEVKGRELSKREIELCAELSVATVHCTYAVAGNIGYGEYVVYKWHPNHPTKPLIQRQPHAGADRVLRRCIFENSFLHYLLFFCATPRCLKQTHPWRDREHIYQAARSARFGQGGK